MFSPPASDVRVRERRCTICDTPAQGSRALQYGRAPWHMVRCVACDFVYLPVVPIYQELVETLAWERTHPEEAIRRRRAYPIQQWLDAKTRWRLALFPRTQPADILNRHGPASGPVVDVGCGSGEGLRDISPRFALHGIEISAVLAARAEEIAAPSGGRVVQATAAEGMEQFADGSLAGVILRSFLEHDADARAVIEAVGRKLRTDGLAIVKVPNYGSLNRRLMGSSWCGFRLPDHVNYFRKRDLARLARQFGLDVSFPFLLSLPTDDNFIALLRPSANRMNAPHTRH